MPQQRDPRARHALLTYRPDRGRPRRIHPIPRRRPRLAALAGGLVGIEREVRGRQAGFRTNLLVAVGSALVMIVSVRMADAPWPYREDVVISVDPARIAYGVMTGIGFLGAGAIIKYGTNIRGLTTAAGLWCVAAMGLAAGLGLYLLTAFASVLVLMALWALDHLEKLLPRTHYRTMTVRRPWDKGCIAETVERVRAAGIKVVDVSFQRTADLKSADVELRISFPNKRTFHAFEQHLIDDSGYELLSVREG